MSGFINDSGKGLLKPIGKFLQKLSSFGMEYDDMVIKNSHTLTNNDISDNYDLFTGNGNLNSNKSISVYDKQYITKREELRRYALQDEIEDILDTLCDEVIVYDDRKKFCNINIHNDPTMSEEQREKYEENIDLRFTKLYNYWGFNNDIKAWNYFRKFLIEGYLAFEIVYSNDQSEIIGFNEVDPTLLIPFVTPDGKKAWNLNLGNGDTRMLYDSQIIYISYSNSNMDNRVSYVERLIRSFNLLRLMEHTRIIWAVVNSSFRMKFVIPLGQRATRRGKQKLAATMNKYRENVDFKMDSGELKIDGNAMLPFTKEYWFPSTNGDQPEMETIGNDGPDLSDVDQLKYFKDKLIKVSKIPWNRFEVESPSPYEFNADSINQQEIAFARFVNRLRTIFSEIIMKPLWIQFCIDYPEFIEDEYTKNLIGIEWTKNNYFEELKEMELYEKRINFIQSMKDGLVDYGPDGDEIKYFSSEFLVRKWLKLSIEDIKLNGKMKQKEKEAMKGEDVDMDDDY